MELKIKVEKFLMKQGTRVGKAAVEFTGEDNPLNGFHLVGFTICDDPAKGMFVMFPMAKTDFKEGTSRNFFFLRPDNPDRLDALQDAILDIYESFSKNEYRNAPRIKQVDVVI